MKLLSNFLLRDAAWPALLLCLLAVAGPAHAQWAWRDASGNTTYSDSPPPPDVRPEAILRRPGAMPIPAGDATTAENPGGTSAPGAPKAASAPKSLAEQDADFRKRREERLKAEQKQADDETKAAQKMETCNQARSYLEMIQSGMRLMRPNPDGTRGFMDDDQRSAEVQKAQDTVAKSCQ